MKDLSEKQSVELCDALGRMLVTELEVPAIKTKVERLVSEYVKKNKVDADPKSVSSRLHWHVQVMLKK